MARIGKTNTGNPWLNIIIGGVFILFGLAATSERSRGYGIIGGTIVIGRGLYQLYQGFTHDPSIMVAPITDFDLNSTDLDKHASWYLYQNGLRHRGQSFIAGTMFLFETVVKDQNLLESYPVEMLMEEASMIIANEFQKEPKIEVQSVIGQTVAGKDKKSQIIDFGVSIKMNFRPKKQFAHLEKLLTDLFRKIDDQFAEKHGFDTPEITYQYDLLQVARMENLEPPAGAEAQTV